MSIYEGVQAQDAASQQRKAAQAAQQAQAQQALLQKNKAIAAATPNAQAQTGGSLTGSAGQSFADILAGYAGQGGTSNPSAVAATSGGNQDVNSLLSSLSNLQQPQTQFSGGFNSPPPPQQGRFNLSSLNLG